MPQAAVKIEDWAERVRGGDVRALARALSEIENRGPRADALLKALFPYAGKAWKAGVTGAPGCGKSTLVDALTARLREQQRSVAILAVDPSSPFTGGSILGDRVRMQAHHADPGVFIRSMATRGSLGGLAPTTADLITVLEAAGRDAILVETVGVGQAEIDVVKLAGVVALVVTPSMGDDIQALKAGVMEIADVFVLNKSDLPGADRAEQQIQATLSLLPPGEQPPPPIVRTVATEGAGVDELLKALEARPPRFEAADEYWRRRLEENLRRGLAEKLLPFALEDGELAAAARAAARGEQNPYEFVERVIARIEAGPPR